MDYNRSEKTSKVRLRHDMPFIKVKPFIFVMNHTRLKLSGLVYLMLHEDKAAALAPYLIFCPGQSGALKLGMCIESHEVNPKMKSIFRYA